MQAATSVCRTPDGRHAAGSQLPSQVFTNGRFCTSSNVLLVNPRLDTDDTNEQGSIYTVCAIASLSLCLNPLIVSSGCTRNVLHPLLWISRCINGFVPSVLKKQRVLGPLRRMGTLSVINNWLSNGRGRAIKLALMQGGALAAMQPLGISPRPMLYFDAHVQQNSEYRICESTEHNPHQPCPR